MKSKNRQAALLFVKYPRPGKVKTRLAKDIGNQKAADLYKKLAEQNFLVTRACKDADLIIVFDPPEDHVKVHQWLEGAECYIPQEGLGLGERLINAFKWAFNNGYSKVTVIGSDTLELTTTIIEQSFEALKEAGVVIGPAKDGGYYLIGLASMQPILFEGISWSTSEVLLQTKQIIRELGIKLKMLNLLEDLDEIKR